MKIDHRHVYGWCDFGEIYKYMTDHASDGDIFVEVGTFVGKSTIFLANCIKDSGKKIDFYAVDPLQPEYHAFGRDAIADQLMKKWGSNLHEVLLTNLAEAEVAEYVKYVKLPSVEAAKQFEDGSLSFVFIDAEHLYEQVCQDIKAWWPKIKKGGAIGGHDYHPIWPPGAWPGVLKAVNELVPSQVHWGNSWFKKID